MAHIHIKWDPEILAGGFRPSSIFDEAEATVNMASTTMAPVLDIVDRVVALVINTTTTPLVNTSVSSTITAPADVVSTGTTVRPAANITAGLTDLAGKMVTRVADLVTTFVTTPTPTTTLTTPSWSTTTPSTILKRAVEKVATRPEVAVEHVSIVYTYVMLKLSG